LSISIVWGRPRKLTFSEKEKLLREVVKEKEEKIEMLNDQLRVVKHELTDLERENLEQKKDIDIHESMREKDKLILEYSIKDKFEEELNDLKEKAKELEGAKEMLASTQKKLTEMSNAFRELKASAMELQEENKELQSSIEFKDVMRKRVDEEYVRRMEIQESDIKGDFEEKLKVEKTKIENEIAEMGAVIKKTENQLAQKEENIVALNKQLNESCIEIERQKMLVAEKENSFINQKLAMQNKLKEAEEQSRQHEEEITASYEDKIISINEDFNRHVSGLAEEIKEYEGLREILVRKESEISELNQKRQSESEHILQLENEKQQFQKTINDYKLNLQEKEVLVEKLHRKRQKPVKVKTVPAFKSSNRVPVYVGIIALIVSVLSGFVYYKSINQENRVSGKNLAEYIISYKNPASITSDGKNIWISDWFEQAVYVHEKDEKLSVIKKYSFSEIRPTLIAWGGDCLWVADSWEGKITCHNLDDDLSVKTTYEYPGSDPAGIYYDGKYLWICDMEEKNIYKFLPEKDKLVEIDVYKSFNTNPVGIFMLKNKIWTIDSQLKRLYMHNMDKNLSVKETYKLPSDKISSVKIIGAGRAGSGIWIATEDAQILQFHKRSLIKL
jgi:hypothetical protein